MGTAIFELITASPRGPLVFGWTVFGVAWQLLTLVVVRRGARETGREAQEIASLARAGLRDKARIRARESVFARPLLDLLSGELEAPAVGGPARSAHYAALALPMAGALVWLQLERAPVTFFGLSLSLAILLATTLASARGVAHLHGRVERELRQAAFPLLESNARRGSRRTQPVLRDPPGAVEES